MVWLMSTESVPEANVAQNILYKLKYAIMTLFTDCYIINHYIANEYGMGYAHSKTWELQIFESSKNLGEWRFCFTLISTLD